MFSNHLNLCLQHWVFFLLSSIRSHSWKKQILIYDENSDMPRTDDVRREINWILIQHVNYTNISLSRDAINMASPGVEAATSRIGVLEADTTFRHLSVGVVRTVHSDWTRSRTASQSAVAKHFRVKIANDSWPILQQFCNLLTSYDLYQCLVLKSLATRVVCKDKKCVTRLIYTLFG